MIRRLRRAHLAWSIVLLSGTASALAVSGPKPARPMASSNLPGFPAVGTIVLAAGLDVELTIRVDSSGGLGVSARARPGQRVADPLLYWAPAAPKDSSALPAGSRFLASLADRAGAPTRLEPGAIRPGGVLVVWSNGQGRVTRVAPMPPLPEPGR